MTNQNHPNILIIEDTSLLWSSMKRGFRQTIPNANIICVGSYEDAVEYLKSETPQLIICDHFLPNLRTGLELWESLKGNQLRIPFILTSGMGTEAFLKLMEGKTVCPAFVPKPFQLDYLSYMVKRMLEPKPEKLAA